MDSSRQDRKGATMYISEEPCIGCLKIIACSGIIQVIWPSGVLDFPFLSCYQRTPRARKESGSNMAPKIPRLREV